MIGLDHPLVQKLLRRWQTLAPEDLGAAVQSVGATHFVLTLWQVQAHGPQSEVRSHLLPLVVSVEGNRMAYLELEDAVLLREPATRPILDVKQRAQLLHSTIEPMLDREIQYRGITAERGGLSTRLIVWVEAAAQG